MPRKNSYNKLTRSAAIKRLVSWLSITAIITLVGFLVGMRTVIPGPAATETLNANAGERIAISAGLSPKDTIYIVLQSNLHKSDSIEFTDAIKDLVQSLMSTKQYSFKRIRSSIQNSFLSEQLISEDHQSVLIIAETDHSIDTADRILRNFPNILKDWNQSYPWLSINYISQGIINNEIFDLINKDLDNSLIYSLPITFVILIWAFRSILVAFIPIGFALVSLLCSLGVSSLLSHVIEPISATSAQLVVLLVLAIGVDYTLFIVSRVREELANGEIFESALHIASKQTGSALFWSGVTVALSLSGLFFMNDTILTSMALVSIVAVLITVLGSLVILPSILFLFGEKHIAKCQSKKTSPIIGHTQQWLINKSIEHPIFGLLTSLFILGVVASFAFELRLGTTVEASIFPNSMQSRSAIDLIQNKFPNVAGVDISLIFKAPNAEEIDQSQQISEFLEETLNVETLRGPTRVEVSSNKDVVRYEFIATGSANDSINQKLISNLRNNLIPKLKQQTGISTYLSGTLPYVADEQVRYINRTPQVFGAVLLLCFIFLLIAFRSLVIPLKAIALNIISTAAAFGVLALVFNHGILGYWHYGIIEAFVPALLYSILFGLSMDYHVLLISRVQEAFLQGNSTKEAVRLAVVGTFRSISSAALIMVSVFAIIASLKLPLMKELGLGLAVAIIVDATIIRLVLLPASMILLNRWNWYLPKCLSWLPQKRQS